MLTILFESLVVSLGINMTMFLAAFWLRSDKLTDISYAISFVALVLSAFRKSPQNIYAVIAVALVCIWALRIGSFLLYRVMRAGSDRRFDDIRDNFWKFGKFWLGQAVTVWVLMIPTTLALSRSNSWHVISFVGVAVWLVGMGFESVADLQKYRFTHDPARKNQWIDRGVWRYSRHPNYFGEIAVWLGIYLYVLPVLPLDYRLVGLISPLFIAILLLFVSGIPILEKGADKRWGSEPGYRAYKKRTSLLIPLPLRKL